MSQNDLVQRALLLLAQQPERAKPKEAGMQQQALDPIRSVQPGDRIEWTRAGQAQQGLVDFVHVDDTGTTWAFVTIGETWAAVNMKFAQGPAQVRLLA